MSGIAGRKGKYLDWITPDGLLTLTGYAREGLTDAEISKKIGIAVQTFYDWCNRFDEFSDAIKKGRKPVIVEVEDTFFEKKLKGYTVTETITEKSIQRDANNEIIGSTEHIRKSERYIPPDTTALIFYLKCRAKDRYNDKVSVSIDDNNGMLADLIDGLKTTAKDEKKQ